MESILNYNNILDIAPDNTIITLYKNYKATTDEDFLVLLPQKEELYQELKRRYYSNYNFDFFDTISVGELKFNSEFFKYSFLKYMDALEYELQQPNSYIKPEYITSFCDILIHFFSFINKSQDFIWDFTKAPKIVDILNNLKNKDLRNGNQIQEINRIIILINDSINKNKKLLEYKVKNNALKKTNISTINNHLKIVKSKLKKSDMESIFKRIEIYPKNERLDLISYIKKIKT